MAGPVGLLVSPAVLASDGERFEAMARQAGVALRCWAALPDARAREQVRAAFFSRELYEGSALRKPAGPALRFFEMVQACPALQWLHVCSAGLDLPLYAPVLARGVRVTGASGVTAVPIAQTVLAAVLAQSRGFGHWLHAQSRRQWAPLAPQRRPREIAGQRAVIVGAGAIARETARLLRLLGFHVTGVRQKAQPLAEFDRTVPFEALDAALPDCDWLILSVPLTDRTRGMLDARRLALLPAGARLVNVARGEIVDEPALVQALRARHLHGAYLDTFCEEPLPPDSPLWEMPEVWISPHNSSASQGHERRVIESFAQAYAAWLRTLAGAAGASGN